MANCLESGLMAQVEEPVAVASSMYSSYQDLRDTDGKGNLKKGYQGRDRVGIVGRVGFLRVGWSTGTE